MKKFVFIAVLLLLAAIGYGVYSIYIVKDSISDDLSPELAEKILNLDINKSPSNPPIKTDFIYGGWIPDWGMDKGIKSLETNKDIINEISPVWYYANADGTLQNKKNASAQDLQNIAIEESIKIIPAIAMFDHEIFTPILQNESIMMSHIDAIINEVEKNDYDGIDLDYESTKLDDKEGYFEFLDLLSQALHKRNKILYVTVLPKWTDLNVYASLPETRQVQDWDKISKYADKIRIMAYDYTYSKSAYPGPIAPIDWLEEILKYASTKADMDTYILGLHLYGYEWYSDELSDLTFKPEMSPEDFVGEKTARSYTYDTILSAITKYDGTSDNYKGEQIFSYEKDGEFRKIIYIDQNGVRERVNLAKSYGLSGVAFWRYGGDENLVTNLK